jgi:hypothetical protein
MSNNDKTPRLNRILLLARYIQNKIEDNTPSSQEFLQFRNEIIRSNCMDLKTDLDHECDLIEKQEELKERLEKVKAIYNDGNKTEFVTLSSKIQVTEKEIRESTRCLNRRFLEHVLVQQNLDKILTDVAWIKNRLEDEEIRNYIENKGISHTETIIEMKDRMKIKEKVMISEIKSLKERINHVEADEIQYNSLKEAAEQSKAELLVLKDGEFQNITQRHKDRQDQLDHAKQRNQSERENIMVEVSLSKKELERELEDHKLHMKNLNTEKTQASTALSHFRDTVEKIDIEGLQKRRDILLSSKDDIEKQLLTCHGELEVYEKRRVEAEEEQMKVIQEEERIRLRQNAALILSNRLKSIHRSNSKKKQMLLATSKKKGTKKKKKK